MNTLSLELYDDLNERFKQNKLMLLVMVPAALIAFAFEISQLQSNISQTKRLLIYFAIFPVLLLSFCILPLLNYFKGICIVESYNFDPHTNSWQFETLSKKSFEVSGTLNKAEGSFRYFGHLYRAQVFTIEKRLYYFPVEKLT